ncbi:MAG: hypothetical protein Kow0042_17000 [Calditrichia bacterium]
MRERLQVRLILMTLFLAVHFSLNAQETKVKNAESWVLSGRIQLQYLYNNEISSYSSETSHGFRIRRGRFQVNSRLNSYVSTKFQFEIRDNQPRLKDAEGKIKVLKKFYLRGGQFKVPVWREELRSSGNLLLVERSAVAEFLVDHYLSARHIGVEWGGYLSQSVSFAANYSNGAGEGGREDAGRGKSQTVNNGKLFTARINGKFEQLFGAGEQLELGISGAFNQLGNKIDTLDDRGTVFAIAPDFGVYLPNGLDFEGGLVYGSVEKNILGYNRDTNFLLSDITGRYKRQLANPANNLGGLDAWEVAAGISYIEPDTDGKNEEWFIIRLGPAFYFGDKTRLQINGEIESSTDSNIETIFLLRSQLTINF